MSDKRSSATDVQAAIDIMEGVLESESAMLRKLLNETERITRETVNAEVEAKNNVVSQKSYQDEIGKLKSELTQAGKDADKLTGGLAATKTANKQLDAEIAGLEKSVASLQDSTGSLESENNGLKKEVDKLQAKRDKLDSDVNRLKDLRAKYLAEIASFKKTD